MGYVTNIQINTTNNSNVTKTINNALSQYTYTYQPVTTGTTYVFKLGGLINGYQTAMVTSNSIIAN